MRGASGRQIGHERQRLVFDVDQAKRVFGDVATSSRDRGDLIAHEPDGRIEQQALLLVPTYVRAVGRTEHGVHAGQGLGT